MPWGKTAQKITRQSWSVFPEKCFSCLFLKKIWWWEVDFHGCSFHLFLIFFSFMDMEDKFSFSHCKSLQFTWRLFQLATLICLAFPCRLSLRLWSWVISASNPHFYGWVMPKAEPTAPAKLCKLGKAGAVQLMLLSLILLLCPPFFASEGHCWFMFLLWSTVIPRICLAFSRLLSRLSLCNLFIFLLMDCSCLCNKPFSRGAKKSLVYLCVCIYTCMQNIFLVFPVTSP